MNDDELNALIDEHLFNRTWTKHPRVRVNDRWHEVTTWLPDNAANWDVPPGTMVGQRPPNHAAVVRWFRENPPPG